MHAQHLEAIVARSRAPGRFVERRRFSLARDKAVEKLRAFALRDPAHYALELVQAAVFSGARFVAIDRFEHHLLFAWVGGLPFRAEPLEVLMDFLFADQGNPEHRRLIQLAIALNALRDRVEWLRIESGD